MGIQPLGVQTLSIEGEVVELLEQDGRRMAKIVVTAPIVLDVTNAGIADAHLGDRVVVAGLMAIESIGHRAMKEEDL